MILLLNWPLPPSLFVLLLLLYSVMEVLAMRPMMILIQSEELMRSDALEKPCC